MYSPHSNFLLDYTNKFHKFKYTVNETGGKSFYCYSDNCNNNEKDVYNKITVLNYSKKMILLFLFKYFSVTT
jgi:hypothetical protein